MRMGGICHNGNGVQITLRRLMFSSSSSERHQAIDIRLLLRNVLYLSLSTPCSVDYTLPTRRHISADVYLNTLIFVFPGFIYNDFNASTTVYDDETVKSEKYCASGTTIFAFKRLNSKWRNELQYNNY